MLLVTIITTLHASHSMAVPVQGALYNTDIMACTYNSTIVVCTYSYHRSIVDGFSTRDLKEASHCAPTAPSTTRWSQLRVTVIMLATRYLEGGREERSNYMYQHVLILSQVITRALSLPLHTLFINNQPLFTGSHRQDARLQERERERGYNITLLSYTYVSIMYSSEWESWYASAVDKNYFVL